MFAVPKMIYMNVLSRPGVLFGPVDVQLDGRQEHAKI
jgi:hypothetical protein